MESAFTTESPRPGTLARLAVRPVFWIALLALSGLCVFSVLRYFGDAFSVLDLDVRMSREQAVDTARRLVVERKLVDAAPARDAASFDGDSAVQTFIELEGGGKPALKPLLGGDEFTLYRWRVRLFTPGVEREVQMAFTSDGKPMGFYVRVPQAEPGAALSLDAARAIAVETAARDWGVDFSRYRALTASDLTQPGKRVDHEFVYERDRGTAPAIGDGRLRLRLLVAGDRLVQLQRFVYVPEAFARRYSTMRSANNNIAAGASLAAGLLYGLGGCLIGTIWLMRRHAIRWKPSALWAGVVAVLIAGASLASAASNWFGYDTATSEATHRFTGIVGALTGGVVTWLLLTVVFGAAEGLGRLAFADHPQLWRVWRRPAANSRAVWGRTLAGYAWIGFDLAFIALFYYVVDRYLGWWSPSDALIDPNILGKPMPWLAPASMALQAGMMEECLFRAIPLAGAALLGRRFGREKLFIGIALVLQAVVFGCAHANYPGQPAYARPVELFVPALVWGVVYLRYGLVPGILFHFGFDLVLMSIPLFVTVAPGLFVDRAMVVALLAVPLVVLTIQRVRAGRLVALPASERNAGAAPASSETVVADDAVLAAGGDAPPPASVTPVARPTRRLSFAFAAFAIVGIVGFGLRLAQPVDTPPLTIGRDRAIAIAEGALATKGVQLDARWRRSARAVALGDGLGATFAWKEGGAALFHALVGRTIAPPHWEVRFARFDGDVAERDSWRVVVVDDRPAPDGVRLVEHDVPEARPGARLSEDAARTIAEAAIADWLKQPASSLRRVSARSVEAPARVDWEFVYADPAVALPKQGEGRIVASVSGDEVTGVGRAIFVPDAWARERRQREDRQTIPRVALAVLGLAFSIAVVVGLFRRIVRGEAAVRAGVVVAVIVGVALAVDAVLGLDVARFGFTIAQPYDGQLLRYTMLRTGAIVAAMLFAGLVTAVGLRIASRAETPRTEGPVWRLWFEAIALALLIAGASGYAALEPSTAPRLPSVDGADPIAPLVSAFLGSLSFPAPAASALLLAAVFATRVRWREAALAIALVASAVLGRASAPDPTTFALVASGVVGFGVWFVYRSVVRDRPWIIAPTVFCLALFGQVARLAHPGYPGAVLDAIAAMVASVVGYRVWRWLIARDRATA